MNLQLASLGELMNWMSYVACIQMKVRDGDEATPKSRFVLDNRFSNVHTKQQEAVYVVEAYQRFYPRVVSFASNNI